MIELKKMAIARFIYRKRGQPRFVALVPQDESQEIEGVPFPPGFHVIYLPYADDIRKHSFDPMPIASPELIQKAKVIVKDFKISYDMNSFENPVLQKHYAHLQALALDELGPKDELTESLQPDLEGMEKYKNDVLSFKEDIFSHTVGDDDDEEVGKKRKRGEGKGEGKKKAKKEISDENIDFQGLYESGQLKKLTIPKLKIYCQRNRLKVAGKKGDLLERVEAHLAAQVKSEK